MKLKYTRQRGIIGLELQHMPEGDDQFPLVAFMLNYEQTPYWILCDRRLSSVSELSPYPDLEANRVRCRFKPKNPQERLAAIALLNEFHESEDGLLTWSTFDGIVRGECKLDGKAPLHGKADSPALYFTRQQAVEQLERIKSEWEAYSGNPGDYLIKNPHAQISRRELVARISLASSAHYPDPSP